MRTYTFRHTAAGVALLDAGVTAGGALASAATCTPTSVTPAVIDMRRVESDSDGVYDAHIASGDTDLIVQVDKSFAVTRTRPMGAPPAAASIGADG